MSLLSMFLGNNKDNKARIEKERKNMIESFVSKFNDHDKKMESFAAKFQDYDKAMEIVSLNLECLKTATENCLKEVNAFGNIINEIDKSQNVLHIESYLGRTTLTKAILDFVNNSKRSLPVDYIFNSVKKDPNLIHPLTKRSCYSILSQLSNQGKIAKGTLHGFYKRIQSN